MVTEVDFEFKSELEGEVVYPKVKHTYLLTNDVRIDVELALCRMYGALCAAWRTDLRTSHLHSQLLFHTLEYPFWSSSASLKFKCCYSPKSVIS